MSKLLSRNIIKPIGCGVAEVHLTSSLCAMIDEYDIDNFSWIKWYAKHDKNGNHYAQGRLYGNKSAVSMHRMVLCFPLLIVDHINRNTLDNRRSNLRLATPNQSMQNRGKSKTRITSSEFIGVTKLKGNRLKKWCSRIKVNGRLVLLGSFSNEIDAAKAYNVAALEHFKEFASLNVFETSDLEK